VLTVPAGNVEAVCGGMVAPTILSASNESVPIEAKSIAMFNFCARRSSRTCYHTCAHFDLQKPQRPQAPVAARREGGGAGGRTRNIFGSGSGRGIQFCNTKKRRPEFCVGRPSGVAQKNEKKNSGRFQEIYLFPPVAQKVVFMGPSPRIQASPRNPTLPPPPVPVPPGVAGIWDEFQ